MNFKRNICLHVHQGMGDHLILCGLVRQLAKEYDLVVMPAKVNNYESVSYMYRDLANVVVRYVLDDDDQNFFVHEVWKGEKLVLGHNGPGGFNASIFDQEFFRQANLSFQLRWDNFHVERETSQEVNINMYAHGEPFIFLHDDPARNLKIDWKRIATSTYLKTDEDGLPTCVRPDVKVSRNLFAWMPVIVNAAEIHCINSSFALLVDSLPRIEGQRLFLHLYARPDGEVPTFRHDWIRLK